MYYVRDYYRHLGCSSQNTVPESWNLHDSDVLVLYSEGVHIQKGQRRQPEESVLWSGLSHVNFSGSQFPYQ